jgi:hypothetical protein
MVQQVKDFPGVMLAEALMVVEQEVVEQEAVANPGNKLLLHM